MTTLAQDTFSRANQSGFGTASDGHTWATATANGVTLAIASNEGTAVRGTDFASMLLGSGTSGDTEGLVRFDVSATGIRPGILLRSTANGQTFYACRAHTDGSTLVLARYNANATGNGTFLASQTLITWVATTFYWMRFRVTGNVTPLLQARFWQDGNAEPGTWGVTFTDSSGSQLTSAGQYGLYLGAVGTSTASFDTFSVNDTQAGSVTHVRIMDGYGGVFS